MSDSLKFIYNKQLAHRAHGRTPVRPRLPQAQFSRPLAAGRRLRAFGFVLERSAITFGFFGLGAKMGSFCIFKQRVLGRVASSPEAASGAHLNFACAARRNRRHLAAPAVSLMVSGMTIPTHIPRSIAVNQLSKPRRRSYRREASIPLISILLVAPLLAADQRGELLNPWAVHQEIRVDGSAAPAVKEFFPTFLEYQDLVMFHPTFGYYASGRVNFVQDYRTFPDALSPYFGHMIAEHIFKMWDGMREAGTLSESEPFTIAEFGAGDGALAESILDYVDHRGAEESGERWRQFARQMVYACYDRSPALSAAQRKRNARFGSRFESREGDATDPNATIPVGSLKGIVLSNELPDAFSVHKVIFSLGGSLEVGFVAPALPRTGWNKLEKSLPVTLQERLKKDDASIQAKVFGRKADENVYLSRDGFVALLENLSSAGDYAAEVDALEFHEIYLPIETIPELAEHIRKYIPQYAYELARSDKAFVAYINLGERQFIQGAGRTLKSGYVVTIDYGSNWDTVTPLEFDHFRSYGPGSKQQHSDPYHSPTFNDMTTDVNFSHVVEEGKLVGLRPKFFGPQHTLITNTPVVLDTPPADRNTGAALDDYEAWVQNFYTWNVYKILIEQKENTDPNYSYPGDDAEPLNVNTENLPVSQQALEHEIERLLRDRLTKPPLAAAASGSIAQ
jgi:SAM-dependent MidA family methyltransferase